MASAEVSSGRSGLSDHATKRRRFRRWPFAAAASLVAFAVGTWSALRKESFAEMSSMQFEQFIELPRSGIVSALDYMVLDGGHLMVAAITTGDVFDIELGATNTGRHASVRTMPGPGHAHGVAVGGEALGFVSRAGVNRVDVFNRLDLRTLRAIDVPAGPDAIVPNAAFHWLYVAGGESHTATIIDYERGEVVSIIPLPGKPEFAVADPERALIYQNIADLNVVVAVSLKSRSVVSTLPLPSCEGPSGLAIDGQARELFVVCSSSNNLLVIDLATQAVNLSVPLGSLSDSVALDGELGRIYVAGGAGELAVITRASDGRHATVERVATPVGAHTLLVEPRTHRLYLACAGFIGPARIAVLAPR